MERSFSQGAPGASGAYSSPSAPVAGAADLPPSATASSVSAADDDTTLSPLSADVLAELHWIASEGTPSLSRHARIVLAKHDGRSLSEIANVLDIDRATVRRWLLRFEQHGLRGLVHGSTGKARKRRFDESTRDRVARIAMASPADAGESFAHWSLRRLRNHILRRGVSPQISVERLLQ